MKPLTVNGTEYVVATDTIAYPCLLRTTPRPISEPPIFDYNWMTKETGWIEKEEDWHIMAYGPAPSFNTQRVDVAIEAKVLTGYRDWSLEASHALSKFSASISTSEKDAKRWKRFMDGLCKNLDLDLAECKLELFDLEVGKEVIVEEIKYCFPMMPGQRERLVRNVKAYRGFVEG